jgi:hypothetical protein
MKAKVRKLKYTKQAWRMREEKAIENLENLSQELSLRPLRLCGELS